jgi:putative transposase
MANGKIIRCDEWALSTDTATVSMARDTVVVYRRLANALASVFLAHWDTVHDLAVQDLETLFHVTKDNEAPVYGAWFQRNFHKVPSYLRRAATMAAHGAVSSFMTRYRAWQGGDRRMRSQRPPRWGGVNTWPTLYAANGGAGAMVRTSGDAVQIKLLDAATGDWLWRPAAVVRRGKRHGAVGKIPKSPMLVMTGNRLGFAQPYESPKPKKGKSKSGIDPACGVDVGVNRQAVCSIVAADGTVIARKFISGAAHIDLRDRLAGQIHDKARQTIGKGGKLSKGFCRGLYRRVQGINTHLARSAAREILLFAKAHGAQVIVFEHLKGWRPKGGWKGSRLKQKFHGWLHRALVKQVEQSAEEHGLAVAYIAPRGTSSFAFDGSGRVVRDRTNHVRCRFRSGKEYDCDLSASYNIAARYFAGRARYEEVRAARKAAEAANRAAETAALAAKNAAPEAAMTSGAAPATPAGGNARWPVPGKRSGLRKRPSGTGPRMPVTLSSLWASAQAAAA